MTRPRVGVTRHTFLVLAAKAMWLFGLGGVTWLWRGHRFLRPPGAALNPAFVAQCMKRQGCQHICPMGVIFPVLQVGVTWLAPAGALPLYR